MSQYFVKGSDQLNGIFCYIKNQITFEYTYENQSWYKDSNPKDYICNYTNHDVYPYPSYPNNYVGFKFAGYFIKPNHLVIRGRSVNDIDLLQHWDMVGLNQYNKWTTLISKKDCQLHQLQFYHLKSL